MKTIADELLAIAKTLPDHTDKEKTIVYSDGDFNIKCVPTRQNVERIAAKYRKGAPRKRPTSTGITSSTGKMAARNFCADGEYHNAANIADCVFSKAGPTPIPLVDVNEFEPGIVVGRTYHKGKLSEWNVTHVLSGLTCSCSAGSKTEAVALFDKVRDKVAEHKCDDYQVLAREFYGVSL